ncbi:ATP-binding protein [Streptomyces sp. NA02536]|uniref:ATP-binding protein n=1 Tax=Streptomyces sp. NA02536 TaxID=2742133 RepID=UPI00158FD34A|nr:ATP-binding protein [Streptomyces sp. NA02536]QKV99128.1 ATP-binding protein [Streptomyces sp. NA02536]
MTGDPVLELLGRWPGRFRFGRLAVKLRRLEQLDDASVIDALLSGIADDEDEKAVFGILLREGELEAAEYLLENGPLSDHARLSRRLQAVTARRQMLLEELRSRYAVLRKRAQDADLILPGLDMAELESRCAVSWPETLPLIERTETDFETELRTGQKALRDRLTERKAEGTIDPAGVESSNALIDAGLLRAAARQIDDGTRSSGPERVPALPPWKPDVSPEQLLEWHLDPVQQQRQARYADWAPADGSARELLEAYASLSDGGFDTAQRFATALSSFLNTDSVDDVRLDEVTGGYLTTAPRAFADPETARFRPLDNLDLFIGGPETREPEGMGEIPPFAAVGPALQRPTGRGGYAVLGLRALLQLATLRTGRSTAVLRVLGPQWPLAAFAGRTPDELDELLGPDESSRWLTLRWIVDLTGLGGITVADALAHMTGWDPALLHLFLQALVERQGRTDGGARWLPQWRQDRPFAAAVEDTVLRPLGPSRVTRIAFWAALAAGPAGEEVTAEELLLEAQLAADAVPDADAIRTAMTGLARLRSVEDASDDRVRFRRCGVLTVLRDQAQQRLEAALRDWAAFPEDTAPEDDGHAVRQWGARRHGLSPGYEEYVTALADSVLAADLDALLAGLARSTAENAVDRQRVDGTTDLVLALREMRGMWQQVFPGRQLEIGAPATAVARISSRAAQVLLYELLANAGEALDGSDSGRVAVQVELSGDEWLVDVRDSGAGITYPQGREDLVFRAGRSTKGEGRGDGLHRARRIAEAIDGDVLLVSRSLGHPVLKGAHFRLILPMA